MDYCRSDKISDKKTNRCIQWQSRKLGREKEKERRNVEKQDSREVGKEKEEIERRTMRGQLSGTELCKQ